MFRQIAFRAISDVSAFLGFEDIEDYVKAMDGTRAILAPLEADLRA